MDCPHCGKALVAVERESIEVDWCPLCGGLWFDAGELELLAERSGRKLTPADIGRSSGEPVVEKPRRCPRCAKRMESVVVGPGGAGPGGNVHAERCVPHGVWLDRGELGSILSRLERTNASDESVILQFLGETFGGER